MNYFLRLFLLLSIPLFCSSQVKQISKKEDHYFPKFKNKLSSHPPGTVKLNDSLYVDISPVNNLMYYEFTENVKNFWNLKAHEAIKNIPDFGLTKIKANQLFEWIPVDSSLIKIVSPHNQNKTYNNLTFYEYSKHPKYYYHPVVYVTKEQAELYCKWRTDLVKILWSAYTKTENERAQFPIKFRYRLASNEELTSAIQKFGYSKKPYSAKSDIPIKPYKTGNRKTLKKPIFYKNNISEYTQNQVFGGNWRNSKPIIEPNDYTGFRCVCEIED